jgi:hypothetical protein
MEEKCNQKNLRTLLQPGNAVTHSVFGHGIVIQIQVEKALVLWSTTNELSRVKKTELRLI